MRINQDQLDRLAQEQNDVVTRAQLDAFGVKHWHIRAQVRARRWAVIGRKTVVLTRGTLTTRQREWIAVLELGSRSALCGLSALAAYGVTGFEPTSVHLVVPRGARPYRFGWLRLHESRRFNPATDIRPVRTPRIVTVERATIDAAVWTREPRTACAIVAAVMRQRLTTVDRLRTELDQAGHVRHRRLLASVLIDVDNGAQTLAEARFARLCRRAGLPKPRQQAMRIDSSGRRRFLDAEFVLGDGVRLAVEIDGSVHLDPTTWLNDQVRQNEIVMDGTIVMRFANSLLQAEPDLVVEQLLRVVRLHRARRPA